MEPTWDVNTMGLSTHALGAGADSSSSGSSSSNDRKCEKKKKRPRELKSRPATVVMTDQDNFRAKVHKFTGMPTAAASSTSEESQRPPMVFKPRAQRAAINVPLSIPSTFCCNFSLTDHLIKLPLIEGDQAVDGQTSNSMVHLPSGDKASNQNSSKSVSLLFEELWEELELTENAANHEIAVSEFFPG